MPLYILVYYVRSSVHIHKPHSRLSLHTPSWKLFSFIISIILMFTILHDRNRNRWHRLILEFRKRTTLLGLHFIFSGAIWIKPPFILLSQAPPNIVFELCEYQLELNRSCFFLKFFRDFSKFLMFILLWGPETNPKK